MKRRITALFMAAIMLLGLVHQPQAVQAAEADSLPAQAAETDLSADPVRLLTTDGNAASEDFELRLTEQEFHDLQQQAAEKNLADNPGAGREKQGISASAVLSGEYLSEDGISRAKWLRNLEILFDLTADPGDYPDNYYPDLSEAYEYYDVMMIAVYYGLLEETPGEEIHPDDAATRDFAAHTLNFLLGREKEAASYSFSDASSCEWPDDAQTAVEAGWFALSSNKFNPQQVLTADEINTILSTVEAYLAEREASSGANSFTFADWVIQIPGTAEISASYDDASEVLTVMISNYSGTLQAGDTFVFFEDDFPYVYGAASVTYTDGTYTVVTTDAPEGAILSYEYSGTAVPKMTPAILDHQTYTINTVEAGLVQVGELQSLQVGEDYIIFTRSLEVVDGRLKGELRAKVFNISVEKKFLFSARKYFILSGNLEFSCTLELTIADISVPIPMASVDFGTVCHLGLELKIEASAKLAYAENYSFKAGVDYQNGKVTWIRQMIPSGGTLSAEGEASLTFGLSARLDFGGFGKAEASFSIGPKAGVSYKVYSSGTPETCLNIEAYLYCGLEASVQLREIITSIIVLDKNHSEPIWDASNSPLKFVEHREDGLTVAACTREHDSGTPSGNYVTPHYTTPADSHRWASSNPNAGSTGRGANGETVTIWETSDNGDGTVTITKYNGNAGVLFIPNTIDGKTVTAIGADAFKGNIDLVSVTVPENVEKIKSGAFRNCTALRTVYINSPYLTTTGYETVYHYGIFTGCKSLQTVRLADGINKIPDGIFYYAPIPSFEIPSSVVEIGTYAFFASSLGSIQLPDGITTIGNYAFQDCTDLTQVTLSANLQSIGNDAFRGCTSLTSLTIPEKVETIRSGAFRGCTALTSVFIESIYLTTTGYETVYHYGIFTGCSSLATVSLVNGIKNLPAGMFYYAPITSFEIPSSITTIGTYAFFASSLENIQLPDGITTIGDYAFQNCTKMSQVTLSTNLQTIENDAFRGCTRLSSISIPKKVKTIKSGAFRECTSLSAVTVAGNYLTTTGYETVYHYGIFTGCSNLKTVQLMNGIKNIPEGMFYYAPITSFEIPSSVTTIGTYAFYASSLENMQLPDGVTAVGNYAFQNCTKMTQVALSANLQSIGNDAFAGCTKLNSITIPEKVETIRSGAFRGCTALASITINSTYLSTTGYETVYHYGIFTDCSSMATVTLPAGLTAIPAGMFYYSSLYRIEIPSTVTSIGTYAFTNCTNLEEITLPVSVTSVGNYAFQGCTYLEDIYIYNPDVAFGSNVFKNLEHLTIHGVPDSAVQAYAEANNIPFEGDIELKNGWSKEDGIWYYYKDGVRLTGWQKISGKWYYFAADGTMQTGWQKIGGKWYYFASDGSMQTGWLKLKGVYYYLDKSGAMLTGWQEIDGKMYYLNASGVMQTGWQKIDGKWYYLKDSGVMVTGWKEIDGKWYYFSDSGVMQTGWKKIGDKWYYFASGGAMQTGWLKLNDKYYYLSSSGVMQTGWLQIKDVWYFFKPSGVMAAKEWYKGYYLNANGSWTYKYKASWKQDNKGWWYGDESGWYAKNCTITIDDKLYTFDASGYMVK